MNELKLANRTDVLAEARSFEDGVDGERGDKIAQDDPRCRARGVPQRERLICPQVGGEQACRDPFGAQLARPVIARCHELSGKISWKRKWTSHAKEISSQQ